jgi:hypothetical protein
MKTYAVLNITYDYILYNFFDKQKELLASKNDTTLYNLYNGDTCDFYIKPNDFFYKNDRQQQHLNKDIFNPSAYSVQNTSEMFKKFYHFIKIHYDKIKNYDYIIRCNSSTFLNFRVLQDVVNSLPVERCYAGRLLNNELVSGTCICFSRDVIEMIANTDIEVFNCEDVLDDVVIGSFICKKQSISPTSIEQYSFTGGSIPDNNTITQALTYPSIRVRNNQDRSIDVAVWNKLVEQYNAAS